MRRFFQAQEVEVLMTVELAHPLFILHVITGSMEIGNNREIQIERKESFAKSSPGMITLHEVHCVSWWILNFTEVGICRNVERK